MFPNRAPDNPRTVGFDHTKYNHDFFGKKLSANVTSRNLKTCLTLPTHLTSLIEPAGDRFYFVMTGNDRIFIPAWTSKTNS